MSATSRSWLPEPIEALLRGEEVTPGRFRCACGREHPVAVRRILNRPGALESLPEVLQRLGAGSAWVITDERTDQAAGQRVRALLARAGLQVTVTVLPAEPPPHPDERALGRMVLGMPRPGPLPVAVGSGTITDLARFVSARLGVPWVAVPTAASVDGFTSSVAAMIVGGLRVTYPAAPPAAVVADPEVYGEAPARLTASGWAELAGKWTALADWALSEALNDEERCPVAARLVEEAARPVREAVDAAPAPAEETPRQDPEAARSLMQGLLQVGVAMLMVASSRPASGSEHHLAHYWEMRDLLEGREPALHGERVGVASLMVQRLYRTVLATQPQAWPEPVTVAAGEHERSVREAYGRAAQGLLEEQRAWPDGPWRLFGRSRAELEARRAHLARRWERALTAVQPYLLDGARLEGFLRRAGAPASWAHLGLARAVVEASLTAARELRPRYTVLHLAGELAVPGLALPGEPLPPALAEGLGLRSGPR